MLRYPNLHEVLINNVNRIATGGSNLTILTMQQGFAVVIVNGF